MEGFPIPTDAPGADISGALAEAFNRLDNFRAVQAGAGLPVTVEAVTLLQESVGIDLDARLLFRDRLEQTDPAAESGQVLLGLVLGLLVGQSIAGGEKDDS